MRFSRSTTSWCAGVLLLMAGSVPAASPAADFARERPSPAARQVANWALASGDARSQPFVVIDKPRARVFVFDAQGRLQAAAPALLGLARGDHTVPGIGERALKDIRPDERTTPAGRFVAEAGRNAKGDDIVWIDYDAAVSLHRVRPLKAEERRLQRLASPTPADNRISYGCINVPAAFFDVAVKPLFSAGPRVVYVLPDQRALGEVFPLQGTARASAAGVATAQ